MDDQVRLLDASETVGEDINAFAEQHGLERKLGVLKRAALLIQNDGATDRIPGITKHEVRALQKERDRKWSQPLMMYLCVAATASGAIGQGWAQSSMNGANLYYPTLFKIGSQSSHDKLIVGLINSGIFLSNGLLGSWLVLPLNNRFGRRGAIFAGAVVLLIFNIAGSGVANWQQLLLCRLALGIGLGVISGTLNIYAAECSPAAIRGGLSVAWQAFCAFGIFLGFLTNMMVDNNPEAYGPLRWRIMLLAPAMSTVPLLILVVFALPESPEWFIKHGEQYNRAFNSLCQLRNTELQAAYEMLTFHNQRKRPTTRNSNLFIKTLQELFTIPRVRRATMAAYTTMLAQQACGINIIAFYSSTIFDEARFTTIAGEVASTVFGLVNVVGAMPAIWTMDSFGRRSLLLLTLPFMAITMGIAGASFSISEEHSKLRFGLTTSMIYLFCLLYSPGMGPVPTVYSAEVFPLSHRELGTSSAVAVTNLFAALLSLTFPWLLKSLGNTWSFLLYAALNVVAFGLVFLFVPETKRRTLQELDEVFEVPTKSFILERIHRIPWKDDTAV